MDFQELFLKLNSQVGPLVSYIRIVWRLLDFFDMFDELYCRFVEIPKKDHTVAQASRSDGIFGY